MAVNRPVLCGVVAATLLSAAHAGDTLSFRVGVYELSRRWSGAVIRYEEPRRGLGPSVDWSPDDDVDSLRGAVDALVGSHHDSVRYAVSDADGAVVIRPATIDGARVQPLMDTVVSVPGERMSLLAYATAIAGALDASTDAAVTLGNLPLSLFEAATVTLPGPGTTSDLLATAGERADLQIGWFVVYDEPADTWHMHLTAVRPPVEHHAEHPRLDLVAAEPAYDLPEL